MKFEDLFSSHRSSDVYDRGWNPSILQRGEESEDDEDEEGGEFLEWYEQRWVLLEGYDRDKFAEAIKDIALLLRRSEIPVVNVHGIPDTLPSITATSVSFNGITRRCKCDANNFDRGEHEWVCWARQEGEESPCEDDSGDPFTLDGETIGLEYCVTNRKPYDAVVGSALLALKHHLPSHFFIASDGKWNVEWKHGAKDGTPSAVALYEHVFPERAPVKRSQICIKEELIDWGMDMLGDRPNRWHRLPP